MADHRFDCCPPAQFPFDLPGDTGFLARSIDAHPFDTRCVVATASCVGDHPGDRRDHRGQGMTVIGIAWQSRDMGHELAAAAALQRHCDRDLDAELVGAASFAFSDALHFGRMQAEDLGSALALPLFAHATNQQEQLGEDSLQISVTGGLAADIAGDTAEIGAQRFSAIFGTLELPHMRITLGGGTARICQPEHRTGAT